MQSEADPLGGPQRTTTTIGRIRATISYNSYQISPNPVIATISFNHPDVVVTNNHGLPWYSFRENGEFWFEFEDKHGTTGRALAKVTTIRQPADQENVINTKMCVDKCDGLRIDERLACVVMCTCSRYDSPLRDPRTSNGL